MINLLNYPNKSLADIVIQNTSRQEGTHQKPNLVKTTKIYNEDEDDYKSLDVRHIMQVMSSKPVNNFIPTTTVQMRNDAMKEVYEKFKSSQIPMEVQYLLTNPDIVRFINEENRNLKTKYEQHAKVHEVLINDNELKSLSPLYIRAEINNHVIPALLDSGSQVNIMSEEIMNRIGLRINNRSKIPYQGVNGDKETFIGGIQGVTIHVGTIKKKIYFYVSNKISEDTILGRPFIREFQVITKSTYNKEQVWVSDDDKEIEIRSYNGYELANQEKFEVMNVRIKTEKKMDTVLQDQMDTEGSKAGSR
ncbi:hypothetical protein HMI55_004345 [Coelomomyces lativittatus]|nr:hypothetical protein HMI55_004345 [Coelomomyces lativittatus]